MLRILLRFGGSSLIGRLLSLEIQLSFGRLTSSQPPTAIVASVSNVLRVEPGETVNVLDSSAAELAKATSPPIGGKTEYPME